MSGEPLLRDELAPGVARLTFNRPDKLNALSTEVIVRFEAALDAFATDRTVRVLVLTGAGERAFVAGADIAEYAGGRDAVPDKGTGLGLAGMSERVEAVAGTLTAGPRPGGGWCVEATVPG